MLAILFGLRPLYVVAVAVSTQLLREARARQAAAQALAMQLREFTAATNALAAATRSRSGRPVPSRIQWGYR